MRHSTPGRRQRNNRSNGGGRRQGNQRNHVFDSNGPDVRIRGTAHQVAEKYEALAKDATGAGDVVLAESYLQHAEHYIRVIASWEPEVSSSDKKSDAENSENQQNAQNKRTKRRPLTEKNKEEDLGLPSSILGAGADDSLESA